MHINDLVELDRRAVVATLAAVAPYAEGDATRPTPCGGWSAADLLAHMTVQQVGFARAAQGERTAVVDWLPSRATDPGAAYETASQRALAAFADLADPDAPFWLPEIRDVPLPARIAVGFHLVDNVVHAWDVATALGSELTLDDELLDVALGVARQVPDGPQRETEGAAFAPARPVGDGAGALDEILLRLGRDPHWPG
jgi:uncharacterized protein (TIGR03086 family)